MEEYIATAILAHAKAEGAQHITQQQINSAFSDPDNWYFVPNDETRERMIEIGFKHLEKQSWVEVEDDPFGPKAFFVGDGLDFFPNEGSDIVAEDKLAPFGPNWLAEAMNNIASKVSAGELKQVTEVSSLDASDGGVWEPLAIDCEDADYLAAVETTEAALIAVEQNNGFSETEPEVRDTIVMSMKTTLEVLKTAAPSREQVVAGLLKPMKFVAKKFADASVGTLAKSAVAALAKFLGLPL